MSGYSSEMLMMNNMCDGCNDNMDYELEGETYKGCFCDEANEANVPINPELEDAEEALC